MTSPSGESNALQPSAAPGNAPVLVVNTGSSSVKLALCQPSGGRLWQEQRAWTQADPIKPAAGSSAHRETPLSQLLDSWLGPLLAQTTPFPRMVVHRLVHGGSRFTAPTELDVDVLHALGDLIALAPLHNGPALEAIHWMQRWLVKHNLVCSQWACFDTGFHASLGEDASTYALPSSWRDLGLRRYGFHGLNHQHVAETVAAAQPGLSQLISCHLGAGCSLCAIAIGPEGCPRSVDTTMGFTPLEGLVMATRSGNVDPGLLLHLLRGGLTVSELDEGLHRRSGLLGLSNLSGDMRELRQAARAGHKGASLAIGVFRHRLLQGIGAMAASLGGVQAIALTGGIGEHDDELAAELEQGLRWLGPVQWLRIPADEEGLMVRLCLTATNC